MEARHWRDPCGRPPETQVAGSHISEGPARAAAKEVVVGEENTSGQTRAVVENSVMGKEANGAPLEKSKPGG